MKRAVKGPESGVLFEKAKKGDIHSLAKLLTTIENNLQEVAPFLAKLKTKSLGIRIGVTGPPGAGKSSLINLLIEEFRKKKLRVAVLAVDPSSPFSGGALLGDRIRMNKHSSDRNVYIRSIGSRGGLGGLSAATGAMATVLEGLNFDIIVIETVGVGQTELQVMNLADATAVILVPESGDVIQTLKAGILEIADLFVVNKSDRPGAEILAHELHALVDQEGEKQRKIILTSVPKAQGISDFSESMMKLAKTLKKQRRTSTLRLQAELKALVLWQIDQNLHSKISKMKISNVYGDFIKMKIPPVK